MAQKRERILSTEQLKSHSWWCRAKARLHHLTHRYRNYRLVSRNGEQSFEIVTFAWRFPGAKWSTWFCSPGGLWEKHTPESLMARVKGLPPCNGAGEDESA